MDVEFPWPVKELNPNHNAHKMKKAKLRAKQKSDCFYITKESGFTLKDKQTSVIITFYKPNKIPRDLDNLLASCKGMLDGMCDALGINDKNLHPITIDWGGRKENGAVIISLENID